LHIVRLNDDILYYSFSCMVFCQISLAQIVESVPLLATAWVPLYLTITFRGHLLSSRRVWYRLTSHTRHADQLELLPSDHQLHTHLSPPWSFRLL